MKKKLTLALATVMAVSSLTACNNQPRTESDIRAEIAKLESELNNASGNSDNAEDTSTSTASNAPSSGNPYFDYGEYIHADPDRDPPVVSVPEQGYQYPDMFDVLPEIEETPVSSFEYEYDAKLEGMRITKYLGKIPKVRVPDKIEGEPVVAVNIGDAQITHLYLPDTVSEVECIEEYIKYANVPLSCTEPFWASGLEAVYLNYGTSLINNYAFSYCDKLTNVTIPDSVTKIAKKAFYKCKALTSITIPNSVTYIGERAFEGCTGLTSITIPDSVTVINEYAFRDCTGLTCITIPDRMTKIADSTFAGCTGLTSIIIPDSVTEISEYAFYGCKNIKATYKGKTYTYDQIDDLYTAINGN